MEFYDVARRARRLLGGIRLGATPVHRVLAWEWQLRRAGLYELLRLLYYQPMFETLCREVGPGTRLEICPDSKLPALYNVDVHLGARVRISARTTLSGARNASPRARIVVGDDSYIGHRCVLRAGTEIVIGRNVLVASNALISGDPGHPLDAVARRTQPASLDALGRIAIGDDAWLAYNVAVLGNVTIGEGAIVAAGAVVVEDVPPYTVVAGNPARAVKHARRNVAVSVPGVPAKEPALVQEAPPQPVRPERRPKAEVEGPDDAPAQEVEPRASA